MDRDHLQQFDRLIFGTEESSVLSIDSFRALDTARIFAAKTPRGLDLEERMVKAFPPEFLLNRVPGGDRIMGARFWPSEIKQRQLLPVGTYGGTFRGNRHVLIERPVKFASRFRMRCVTCRAGNWLSSEDYVGSPESMMKCTSCGDEFNFGPAVIELADPEDPALDDTAVPQLAWYHTTIDPEWPRSSKFIPNEELQGLRTMGWREDQLRRHQRKWENQAIHLGTYEAAVDSMLRRMRNQGDQNSVFYLHRVRLRPDLVIELCWRDENSAEAAKITRFDLADDGIDGIRYLNAYEAIGSLSLAVARGAIESTQRVVLPIPSIVTQPDKTMLMQLCALRDHVRATVVRHAGDVLTPLSRLRQQRMRPEDRATTALAPPEAYDNVREMEQFVAGLYLRGLSPVAQDGFLRSLQSPRPEDSFDEDRVWLNKFISLAALLTHADEVQKIVRNEPWRPIQPAQQP